MAHTERLAQLYQNLVEHFDREELHDLCFDLGVKYDDLGGEGITAKARELITVMLRQNRLAELATALRSLRPNVDWPDVEALSTEERLAWTTATEMQSAADYLAALRRLLGWNEKRLAQELAQRGIAHLSHTTVGRIFACYHLPTTHLADGTRVVILVLTDDYSRYCLRCQVVPDMTAETAIQVVQAAWQEFGLPAEIVSDNGRAFTTGYEDSLTVFGETLQHKGIQHRLITPYYPEDNGKAEAFVKIVKRECLNRPFTTIQEVEQALAEFVLYYNHFRLHSSLGYQPPVTRYLGVPAIRGHGLAGIPALPEELVVAFPPAQPVTVLPVNAATVKRRFALVSVSC